MIGYDTAACPAVSAHCTEPDSEHHEHQPIIISEKLPSSFFTPTGARRKKYYLRRKGLPLITGYLLLTFSVDPKRFSDPASAFHFIKKKLPRFFDKLKGRGYKWSRYGCKFEFHDNGYPHIHALVDLPRHIPQSTIKSMWGTGNVDVRRVEPGTEEKVFDYVLKAMPMPEWVRSLPSGTRFWQTTGGFYTNPPKRIKTPPAMISTSRRFRETKRRKSRTLGEQHQLAPMNCVVSIPLGDGRYMHRSLRLRIPAREFIASVAQKHDDSVSVIPPSSPLYAGRIVATRLEWVIENLPIEHRQPLAFGNRATFPLPLGL